MSDRGEFRAIHTVLLDGPDFQRLSVPARWTLICCRLATGPSGIDVVPGLVGALEERTGHDAETVTAALAELADAGWIERDRNVLWVVGGLQHEPSLQLNNANHRKSVRSHINGLPHLPILQRFREKYSEWYADAIPEPARHDGDTIPDGIGNGTGDGMGDQGKGKGIGIREKKSVAAAPRDKKRASRSATDRPASISPEKPPRETWLTPFGEEWEARYGENSFPWQEAARTLRRLVDKPPDEKRERLREYLSRTKPDFVSLAHFAKTYGGWTPGSGTDDGRPPEQSVAVKFLHLLKPILHLPGDAFRSEVDGLVAAGRVRDKTRFLELAGLLDFGYLRTVRTDDEAIRHIAQRLNGHANGVAA